MQKAVGAENFEELLNENYNDNPCYFYTTYECKMLGDKIPETKYDEIEEKEPVDVVINKDKSRAIRRSQFYKYKNHLNYLNSIGNSSGAYEKEYEDGHTRIVRIYRTKESKQLKQLCNQKFRNSNKLKLIVTRSRSIYHKATR